MLYLYSLFVAAYVVRGVARLGGKLVHEPVSLQQQLGIYIEEYIEEVEHFSWYLQTQEQCATSYSLVIFCPLCIRVYEDVTK